MPDAEEAPPTYTIIDQLTGAYLARSENGRISLLVPVTDVRPPLNRATGDIILAFHPNVDFEIEETSFGAPAAVVECANDALAGTFRVLAEDVARTVSVPGGRPSPHEVSRALARWEELLRSKRTLSRDDEIGLWGELWMMLQLPTVSCAVAVWRG